MPLKRTAFYFYFGGLVLLIASLPLSMFTMSVSQFIILGGWLIDGNIKEKLRTFFRCTPAVLIASIYLMHLLGLLYTSDFNYAFKDLRIKLPLLILPVVLSSAPKLSTRQFTSLLYVSIAAVAISTFISMLVLNGVINRPVNDIRDISIFISHIRLALLVCIAFFSCVWIIYRNWSESKMILKIILGACAIWFVLFLGILESLTGMSVLIFAGLVFLTLYAFRKGKLIHKVLVCLILIAIPVLVYSTFHALEKDFSSNESISMEKLDKLTPSGNPYVHYTDRKDFENGYYTWIYVCEPEMEKEWNRRSRFDYYGKDERKQDIRFTLIRFLSSKGLRKDSAGVWSLSTDEVRSIEKGIANVDYQGVGNLYSRVHQVAWEFQQYENGNNPSGHSVVQRLEFWKTAIGIIKNNLLIGVGTGDVPAAFENQYNAMNSKLAPEWRLRSHNQFLSITVAFGIIGLCWFLLSLVVPLLVQLKRHDALYLFFAITAILSMLTEDTLETQAGVTFFALFNCLFLFVNPEKSACGGKKDHSGERTS